jgi:hypothetical protein
MGVRPPDTVAATGHLGLPTGDLVARSPVTSAPEAENVDNSAEMERLARPRFGEWIANGVLPCSRA